MSKIFSFKIYPHVTTQNLCRAEVEKRYDYLSSAVCSSLSFVCQLFMVAFHLTIALFIRMLLYETYYFLGRDILVGICVSVDMCQIHYLQGFTFMLKHVRKQVECYIKINPRYKKPTVILIEKISITIR